MRRSAFTLVEMLVVIVLALLLMTLALMVVPNLSDKRAAARAADQLQGWLAQARSRAMRDGAPRGLQLITNGNQVTEFEFVEQPPPLLPITVGGPFDGLPVRLYCPPPPPPNPPTTTPQNVNTVWIDYDVIGLNRRDILPGDFLEISHGTLTTYRIAGIAQAQKTLPANEGGQRIGTTLTLGVGAPVVPQAVKLVDPPGSSIVLPAKVPLPGQAANWRVIRTTRPLAGEPTLQMPAHTLIDLDMVIAPPNPIVDEHRRYGRTPGRVILFSPSGALIDSASVNPVLWVRHDQNQGQPTLIGINPRSGAIVAHPVNDQRAPGMQFRLANPFQFVDDGLSSGL